jgi:hypothetical protein
MFRATVPKTSIDEYCDPLATKCEIRPTRQWQVSSPTLDSMTTKDPHYSTFSCFIIGRGNRSHYLRALSHGKHIGHRRGIVNQLVWLCDKKRGAGFATAKDFSSGALRRSGRRQPAPYPVLAWTQYCAKDAG